MWLILSLIIAVKFYSDFTLYYDPVKFWPCVAFGVLFWFTWACLARWIAWLSGRFNKKRERYWIRFLIGHLTGGVLISLLHYVAMKIVFVVFDAWNWFPHDYYPKSMLLLNYAIYVSLVAIEHAVYLFGRNAQLEIQQAELKAELSDARLQALKMQLHPHFFFNSLNTVRMLIETDTEKAVRVTTLLGNFLRVTLDSNEENEITLDQELSFIQGYLEIQQIRFEDRIRFHFDISDNSLQALVPNLILQPIVENAMVHGCGKSVANGELKISTNCRNQSLVIQVQDSGCGLVADEFSEGIGLSNTRSRLQRMYGDAGSVAISKLPANGTLVELTLPLQNSF